MNYRRPPNDPYWQPHSSAQQPAYQRGPGNDFAPSSNFELDDFIPYNGLGRRPPQPQGLADPGPGYPYNPPAFQGPPMENPQGYRRYSDAYQEFDPSPGAWVQPPHHGHAARPQVFHDDEIHYRVVDGRSVLRPPEETLQHALMQSPQVQEPQIGREWPPTNRLPPHEHQQAPMEILPHAENLFPTQPPPPKRPRKNEPAPPGISENTETNPKTIDQPGTSSTSESPKDPPSENTEKVDKPDEDSIILHPVTKDPVIRRPNGTYELVSEKKPKQEPPPLRPKKLPEEIGDSCYCELCDLVCSGPLNLRMHLSGAKHKLNEAKLLQGDRTIVRKNLSKKLRDRFASGAPIPEDHNQEETPIIGLDFVTRIVCPDKDESEDLFECSLCDKKDLMAKCIYSHVMGRAHRKAYIRKLKPDLSDQYSNVANVYNQNGQLQRRQNSDLTALLNSIIKIAAKRDGPGEMQIRLWNEEEENMEPEDYGLRGYNSEPEDADGLPFNGLRPLGNPHFEANPHLPQMPELPRAPYQTVDPPPLLLPLPRDRRPPPPTPSNAPPPVMRLGPFGPEALGPAKIITRLPSRTTPPEKAPRRQPPLAMTRLSPRVTSTLAAKPGPSASIVTRLTSKSPQAPGKGGTRTTNKQFSPADLPPLTDDQLRFYCSDVFIAQEYKRRFGEPASQQNQENELNASIGTAQPGGTSVEAMLKTLSDTMVHNEEDANMAMELTRALTQATLKYRLREKNYALKGKPGKK